MRIVVMRATIHLVTADDCLLLRPLVQPVLDAELARHPEFGPAIEGVDLAPVLAFAATLLAERPRNGKALRSALRERFPDHDSAALAYACRNRLALVQVPPLGLWGRSAQVTSTTAESWLGRPLVTDPSIDDVVLRYLAAFGPGSVADVAYWSRLTGLGEVVERLGPRLRSFADERGRRLLDLPDAPRPEPDVPSPPRFLPRVRQRPALPCRPQPFRLRGEPQAASRRRRAGARFRALRGLASRDLVDRPRPRRWTRRPRRPPHGEAHTRGKRRPGGRGPPFPALPRRRRRDPRRPLRRPRLTRYCLFWVRDLTLQREISPPERRKARTAVRPERRSGQNGGWVRPGGRPGWRCGRRSRSCC